MFTIEETEAMVLALALLERTGDGELKQAAKRISQKIAGALPQPLRQALSTNALHVWGSPAPSPGGIDLALVRRAIRDERNVGDRLSRRTRPGHGTDHPADRADLLFADRQYRGLVRIRARRCATSAPTAWSIATLSTRTSRAKATD